MSYLEALLGLVTPVKSWCKSRNRATFSFPVDLNNYWAVNSKEFDYKLKPGTYWLAAHLNGFSRTDQRFSATMPGQPAFLFVDASRMVTPQTAFGPPPRSNILRFEIPSR